MDEEGKLVEGLQGCSKMTDQMPHIEAMLLKNSDAHLVYAEEQVTLINKMLKSYTEHHYQHLSISVMYYQQIQADGGVYVFICIFSLVVLNRGIGDR